MKEKLITQLKDYEKKYFTCEHSLSEKLDEIRLLNQNYQCLLKEKNVIETNYERLLNDFNDKDKNNESDNQIHISNLEKIKNLSSDLLRNEIEKRLSDQFEIEIICNIVST